MAGVRQFEEWAAWQKARALTADVYRVTGRAGFREDFALKNQIQRASVSIMSNIAEGFERYSRQEFKQFLSVARGSAAEVRCQLYVALDLGYLEQSEFNELKDRCAEVSRLIAAMRATVDREDPNAPT